MSNKRPWAIPVGKPGQKCIVIKRLIERCADEVKELP
jgi:hypothetical protein